MTFSEYFAIVLGTIVGIFILLPIALWVFLLLVALLSPLLFFLIPVVILYLLVWLFCKIFQLRNPFDLEKE